MTNTLNNAVIAESEENGKVKRGIPSLREKKWK
jgi:hypothetical protein